MEQYWSGFTKENQAEQIFDFFALVVTISRQKPKTGGGDRAKIFQFWGNLKFRAFYTLLAGFKHFLFIYTGEIWKTIIFFSKNDLPTSFFFKHRISVENVQSFVLMSHA